VRWNAVMQNKRPLIITCLSILLMMFFGLGFPIFLFKRYPQESVDFVASQCGLTAFLARHYGVEALSAAAALFSLAAGVIGFGLWRLLPWARVAMIVVSFSAVCSGIEQLIEFKCTHSCRSVDLTSLLVFGVLLYYFSRPKIRQVFPTRTSI
jgi:hypothetical protein